MLDLTGYLAGCRVIAPLALELSVLVPGNLLVTAALVVPYFLDALCLELAALEITRKLPHLRLHMTRFVAIIVVVLQIGCQGISQRPI